MTGGAIRPWSGIEGKYFDRPQHGKTYLPYENDYDCGDQ
jgi:hypothetical protein